MKRKEMTNILEIKDVLLNARQVGVGFNHSGLSGFIKQIFLMRRLVWGCFALRIDIKFGKARKTVFNPTGPTERREEAY